MKTVDYRLLMKSTAVVVNCFVSFWIMPTGISFWEHVSEKRLQLSDGRYMRIADFLALVSLYVHEHICKLAAVMHDILFLKSIVFLFLP